MKIKSLLLLCLMFLAGCSTTPLFVSDDRVSIYLRGEPEVTDDSFRIKFKFDSPTADPHLIQTLRIWTWSGTESFRVTDGYMSFTDTHYSGEIGSHHIRRMTIMPGSVEDTDETLFGFSMLPSGWPDGFNRKYREDHEIKGRVAYVKPEHATTYTLTFVGGVLTWRIVGTDIKHVWRAEGK